LGADFGAAFVPGITGAGIVVIAEKKIAGKITGYTKHGLNQAISRDNGRGVAIKYILDAVKNPKKVIQQSEGKVKYVGKNATVILNKDGKVITTYGKPRNRK
jgi:hypothetical protein